MQCNGDCKKSNKACFIGCHSVPLESYLSLQTLNLMNRTDNDFPNLFSICS